MSANSPQLAAAQDEATTVANLIATVQATATATGATPMTAASALSASSLSVPSLTNSSGTATPNGATYTAPDYNTNLLWLQITNVSGGVAYANLHHPTNWVYAIWSTPDLLVPFSQWSVETELFPTNSTTNIFPFMVSAAGRTNLFLKAQDWTGVYANGLPRWWVWYNFHTLNLSAASQDANGNTLGYDYTNHIDPTTIVFAIAVTNDYVNTASPNLMLDVIGVPGFLSVLVNDTNLADAVWRPYTSSNVMATLGADGNYNVSVGLRGFPTNAAATWETVALAKNTIAPRLTITNLVSTVDHSPIQFKGFAKQPLDTLTYDLSNASGTITNQTADLTGLFYDTNLLVYTTNYFQTGNLVLASGANLITFHATDWAGNSTNVSYIVNLSPSTNPLTLKLIWPAPGANVLGPDINLQAFVSDTRATVMVTANSNTIPALVATDGYVWVQNLFLNPGSNTLVLTATSASGSTTTNFSVNLVTNSMGLSVNFDPDYGDTAFNVGQTYITVTTLVDPTPFKMYANGVQATGLYTGNGLYELHADLVQVNAYGMANIVLDVYGTNQALVATANILLPQAMKVVMKSYSGHQTLVPDPEVSPITPTESDNINWSYYTGGIMNYTFMGSSEMTVEMSAGTNGNIDMDNFYGPVNPPLEYASLNGTIPGKLASFDNHIQTRVMIEPSGIQTMGTTNVYLVWACAFEASDTNLSGMDFYDLCQAGVAWWFYGGYGGDIGLPPSWLQINGNQLVDTGQIDSTQPFEVYQTPFNASWGATIVAAAAGDTPDVTPVATQVYKNLDYTFDVQAYQLSLKIYDQNGIDLTLQTNTVIVGQQMNLTCKLSVEDSYMTNFVLTNFQWTVPGVAISNYVVAEDTSSAMVVTNFATNRVNTVFYWVDGASNRTVQCSATVNGVPIAGQATLNVLSPTAKITTFTTSVGIFPREQWQWLFFNSYTGPGITFSNSVNIPAAFPGSIQWVQIDFNTILKLVDTNSTAHTNLQEHIGPYLDTTYPYITFLNGNPVDDPGMELPNGSEYALCQQSDTFEMWMMYQPSNGIPVPLRAVNWSWTGSATNYLGLSWMLKQGTNTVNPADFPTTTFPQWNSNVTNAFLNPSVNYN